MMTEHQHPENSVALHVGVTILRHKIRRYAIGILAEQGQLRGKPYLYVTQMDFGGKTYTRGDLAQNWEVVQ